MGSLHCTYSLMLSFFSVEELQESPRHQPSPLKQRIVSTDEGDSESSDGVSSDGVSSEGDDSGEEHVAVMEVTEKPKERWDCESILR